MTAMDKSLTVVVPAFNEEQNILSAIENVKGALEGMDWEIIVVNDGSSDQTGSLAEKKAKTDARVRVVHNEKNLGYGHAFQRGVGLATRSYIGIFPGDNDMSAKSLLDLVENIGDADMITAYMSDSKRRPWGRRCLSRLFVFLLSVLFGLPLKYYNGPFICRRGLLQSLAIKSEGLTALAECKIRLLKMGCTYKEIRFDHTGRQAGRSSALRWKSIKQTLRNVAILFKDIYLTPRVLQQEPGRSTWKNALKQ